jgi:hypothetical protein
MEDRIEGRRLINGMGKLRHFILVTFAVLVVPIGAHGQWARSRTEHDWHVTVGGQEFGIVQRSVDMTGREWGWQRTTTIYVGPYRTSTRLHAGFVAIGLLVPIVFGGFLGLSWLASGQRTRDRAEPIR